MSIEKCSMLERIPLHITAGFLASLDSMQHLAAAIRAHSVFLAAFNDNRRSIISSILLNQIPVDTLPLAFLLHDSARVAFDGSDTIDWYLAVFECALGRPASLIPRLLELSTSDASTMSRAHSAIESLTRKFADETIPIYNQWLRLLQHSLEISPLEQFRIMRAFYRYQSLVNMYYTGEVPGNLDHERLKHFFDIFSPWANEQLACVYEFLDGKTSRAFEEMGAHDVQWGALSVTWVTEERYHQLQDFLVQGLPFLDAVCQGNGYDDWCNLMRVDSFKNRPLVASPYNLIANGLWWSHRHQAPLETFRLLCQLGWAILEEEELYGGMLGSYIREFPHRRQQPLSHRTCQWQEEEVTRSQKRRADIWLAGGTGYWPRDGLDLGRVKGLSEDSKARLLEAWKS